MFIYHVDDEIGHLVNPVVDLGGLEEQDGEEGCLFIPGWFFDCKRHLQIVAKGMNMRGEPVTVQGGELLASCVLHETDHLDGVLFIDRLDTETRRAALKAIRAAERNCEHAAEVKGRTG